VKTLQTGTVEVVLEVVVVTVAGVQPPKVVIPDPDTGVHCVPDGHVAGPPTSQMGVHTLPMLRDWQKKPAAQLDWEVQPANRPPPSAATRCRR
jgi:hypothetical protein